MTRKFTNTDINFLHSQPPRRNDIVGLRIDPPPPPHVIHRNNEYTLNVTRKKKEKGSRVNVEVNLRAFLVLYEWLVKSFT